MLMSSPDFGPTLQTAIEKIDDPYVLAAMVIVGLLIWKGPEYIRAIGECSRLGKKNRVDIERKQARLDEEVKASIAKRQRKRQSEER